MDTSILFLDNLDLPTNKTWLPFDTAAQYPRITASPNTCKSIIVTDSCFSDIDLGISALVSISNFHLTHFCLIVNSNTSTHGVLRSQSFR